MRGKLRKTILETMAVDSKRSWNYTQMSMHLNVPVISARRAMAIMARDGRLKVNDLSLKSDNRLYTYNTDVLPPQKESTVSPKEEAATTLTEIMDAMVRSSLEEGITNGS